MNISINGLQYNTDSHQVEPKSHTGNFGDFEKGDTEPGNAGNSTPNTK